MSVPSRETRIEFEIFIDDIVEKAESEHDITVLQITMLEYFEVALDNRLIELEEKENG